MRVRTTLKSLLIIGVSIAAVIAAVVLVDGVVTRTVPAAPDRVAVSNTEAPTAAPAQHMASEEAERSVFYSQPGKVLSITPASDGWNLVVDLLSVNPAKRAPDDGVPRYLNLNPRTRNLRVTSTTLAYKCGVNPVWDAMGIVPSTPSEFIGELRNIMKHSEAIPEFDISGDVVTKLSPGWGWCVS